MPLPLARIERISARYDTFTGGCSPIVGITKVNAEMKQAKKKDIQTKRADPKSRPQLPKV